MTKLHDAVIAIRLANNIQELSDSLKFAFHALGFNNFSVILGKVNDRTAIENPIISTFDPEIHTQYARNGWVLKDSHLVKASTCNDAFWWTTNPENCGPEAAEMLKSFKIEGGVLVPLSQHEGIFSAAFAAGSQIDFNNCEILASSIVLANTAAMRLEMLGYVDRLSKDEAQFNGALTAKQIEILNWAAIGKSNSAIADILGLKKSAVDYHLRMILQKLGVATKTQAVALFSSENLRSR